MKRKSDDRDGSASTPGETTQPMRDIASVGAASQATGSLVLVRRTPCRSGQTPRRCATIMLPRGEIGADAFKKSVCTFFVAEREKHLKLNAEAD